MRSSKNHLGIGFEVWTAQETWFWFVANLERNGIIGAAATESEAEREARRSIEEMADSIALCGWENSFQNLARYLSTVCDATA
jgi:hypothetical protein